MIGTGLAIGLIAGKIGADLIGAKVQSNAAKKASEKQVESAGKADTLVREQYNDTKAALSPWIQNGAGANNTLGSMMGIKPQATAPVGPGQAPVDPSLGQAAAPDVGTHGERVAAAAGGQTAADLMKLKTAEEAGTRPHAAQVASTSSYTSMVAPNGRTVQVPNDKVDEALKRGAQRVA